MIAFYPCIEGGEKCNTSQKLLSLSLQRAALPFYRSRHPVTHHQNGYSDLLGKEEYLSLSYVSLNASAGLQSKLDKCKVTDAKMPC